MKRLGGEGTTGCAPQNRPATPRDQSAVRAHHGETATADTTKVGGAAACNCQATATKQRTVKVSGRCNGCKRLLFALDNLFLLVRESPSLTLIVMLLEDAAQQRSALF